MSSIQDLRPILLVARAFGLAPYSISKCSISLSRRAMLYSTPWLLFYVYSLYDRVLIYLTNGVESKYLVLTISRTILTVTALGLDVALCIVLDKRLQSALECMRKYDLAVKYDVGKNARMLKVHTWTIVSCLMVYFMIIGLITYFNEVYENLIAAIIYVYLYLPLVIATMKFVVLITSIYLRFRHLNRMLYPGLLSIVVESESEFKRLHLRDVCWLHCCLSAAAEDVNSLYSLQLLLWFANFTFNTISRIYTFAGSGKEPNTIEIIRDGGLVFVFVLMVSLLAAVCHFTSIQANKVGANVFSPSSRYFRVRIEPDKEEKLFTGQYFALHPLHFSAASGFFRINLPLLLKIVGAMTTYLVILKSPTKC